jgi:hypothetical protein
MCSNFFFFWKSISLMCVKLNSHCFVVVLTIIVKHSMDSVRTKLDSIVYMKSNGGFEGSWGFGVRVKEADRR